MDKILELEKRIKELEKNKIGVIMNSLVDQNIYRSLIRTLEAQGISTGIGTSNPNLQCIIDIASTTKAFRLPCMTTAQRDAITTSLSTASKAQLAGALIFNTSTVVLNFYSGTAWAAV